jgi:hypothetical protein
LQRKVGRIGRLLLSTVIRSHPNNDRRDAVDLDGGVVGVGVGKLREMDKLISDFLQFAGDLFARLHPQLDRLADLAFENGANGIIRLKVELALRESARAGDGDHC